MVTKWNVKRIVGVIIFAVIPFMALVYFMVKPDESLLLIKPGQMDQDNPADILESETVINSGHPPQSAAKTENPSTFGPKDAPKEVTVPPMEMMPSTGAKVDSAMTQNQATQPVNSLAQSGQSVMNEDKTALPPESPLVPAPQTEGVETPEQMNPPETELLKENSAATVPSVNLPTTGNQAIQRPETEFEHSRREIKAKSDAAKEASVAPEKMMIKQESMPEPSIKKAELANQKVQQSVLDNEQNANSADADKIQAAQNMAGKESAGMESETEAEAEAGVSPEPAIDFQENRPETPQKPAKAIIYDERIRRTVLAQSIKNKEPKSEIGVPIVARQDRAVVVYFFTEITNMKGAVLFHHWLHDGESVFKRKIGIFGDRWRASTSKMISYSGKGHWVVQLINSQGKILSKIEFDVI